MISQLRKKIFWSILISTTGILGLILITLNVFHFMNTREKYCKIMNNALSKEFLSLEALAENPNEHKQEKHGNGDLSRMIMNGDFFVLDLSDDGSIPENAELSVLEFNRILSILKRGKDHGYASNWFFRTKMSNGSQLLYLMNIRTYQEEILYRILISCAGFLISCGIFALLSHFLSKRIVKPIEHTFQMQKQFIADASHELKTPLTVIDANASVLESSIGSNKWLDYIKEESQKMSDLVQKLLVLAKADESELSEPAVLERLDAVEVITEGVLPFESLAYEKGHLLETELLDSFFIQGNASELKQILGILIDNAIKHSYEKEKILVKMVPVTDRKKSHLDIVIQNTGDTIPKEALSHIFDRFYRIDSARTGKDNSFGLGLSIAKALVEKNMGEILVSSQNNKTEFTLRFAAAK